MSESAYPKNLLDVLANLEPLGPEDEFPDIDISLSNAPEITLEAMTGEPEPEGVESQKMKKAPPRA